jgi:predicted RNA binding protein YcfA (HicA-like mRNA interferase family)
MSYLANISGDRAVKIFMKFGYQIGHQTGSHIIIFHDKKPTLSIPNHKEIAPYLLKSLIKKSGISLDNFMEYK